MKLRIPGILLCVVIAQVSSAALFSKSKGVEPSTHDFARDIKPLLEKYCYGCHGETKQKADLSLQSYENLASILTNRPVWERVLHNVQTREMPPENKPQPSEAERERITKWIEAEVFNCDCDNPDPGRVTLRRLNRAEYNNTIRDLLGVYFHPADDFPADDSGYGFDNNGDVLSLPPILLEKYMAAAEKILDAAIVTRFSTNGPSKRFAAGDIYSRLVEWGYQHLTVNHGRGEYARDDDGDGFHEVHVNTMEGCWSLLRSWLRPHRGISQEKLPLYVGLFQFVHNARKRGKALLESLVATLVHRPPRIAG